ncbi:MAG: hypothetical protein K2O11_00780 [Oscillospiraceae bacterium]|nr:hypothetical protein [Oscillospiraceae bacterium]
MYLSKENINTLHNIITELNRLESESEQKAYLREYTEDADLLLQTLRTVNKKKLPKGKRNPQESERKDVSPSIYNEKEINLIFKEKDEKTLLDTYSLAELRGMYYAIYQKSPAVKSKKEDIYKILKNRFSTMDRAAAFTHLSSDSTYK